MPKANPDHLLASEQLRGLNEQFYRSRPYSYLHQRLVGLLLVACEPESVVAAAQEPLSIAELKITVGELRPQDERAIDYAALESIVLLHHASEALFRIYFAHSNGPACPWLEASRIAYGGAFKTKVKKMLDSLDNDEELRADILKVFRGTATYQSASDGGFAGTEAQWTDHVAGFFDLLTLAGNRLLKEGTLYNAAKHGLAVHAGQVGISLGDADPPLLHVDGPAVALLDVNPSSQHWEKVITWVHVDTTIALTSLVIREVEAIFQIGRLRYLGELPTTALPTVTPAMINALQTQSQIAKAATDASGTVMLVETMREELTYYAERPA